MPVRFLEFLNARASTILALCLFAGIALPDAAAFARPVLVPAVTFLLASAILRMDWVRLADRCESPARLSSS